MSAMTSSFLANEIGTPRLRSPSAPVPALIGKVSSRLWYPGLCGGGAASHARGELTLLHRVLAAVEGLHHSGDLDNHSAHISKETMPYLASRPNRFIYVHTSKHGSWLNLIETEDELGEGTDHDLGERGRGTQPHREQRGDQRQA
jgi:hypothetical protein